MSLTQSGSAATDPRRRVARRARRATAGERLVALVGNPNCGKTTLFNALTGHRQKVGNYPGVTVEMRSGVLRSPAAASARVLDLPGTYSLVTLSPDERIVRDTLTGALGDAARPDIVVAVVDASNLARNLYLVSQLVDLRLPVLIALNMVDVASSHGRPVSVSTLEAALGCPVVPVVGHRREGIRELSARIHEAVAPRPVAFAVPDAMLEEERALSARIMKLGSAPSTPEGAQALARRLLVGEPGLRGVGADPSLERAARAARSRLEALGIDAMQADIEARYRWIDGIVEKAVRPSQAAAAPGSSLTDRLDAVLIHRFLGLAIFALIMTLLFTSVFWLAKPLMAGVQAGVAWLGLLVGGAMAEGPLRALIVDGVFAGVGAVLGFVPQIALLFLFLAALEDSGYLARAAFLMDSVLSRVGLHGKSFVPLLSSFACAIPGILATRTIDERRDRLATILVAPFMSCSARLPVYALLIGACFPKTSAFGQASILLGLYALGIATAALTSWVIERRLDRGRPSAFILELPTYKRPQGKQLAWQVWTNTRAFLTRAGTTIFALSVVMWALLYYPRLPPAEAAASSEQGQRAAQIEYSLAGRFGHAIEPAVRPLGFDWKMGVGLVGAFAAREVFVSTLGVTYAVGDVDEDTGDLAQAMAGDRYPDGRKVWTPLVAVSLLVWFVLAMQCLSTLAVARRETGGWKWPVAQLVFMNAVAYVACLLLYQIGVRLLGA